MTVSDPSAAAAAAREAAYAEALDAARQLADLAGATLGPALEIVTVDHAGGPVPMARMALASAKEFDAGLVPGARDVSVTLRVRFALI